jgi:ubiquitin-activating enzyme E1
MIEFITNEEKALVTIAPDEVHNLSDGEYVRFEEVGGMTELNGKSYRVTVKNMRSFYIDCDTREFGKYELVGSGGYGNQIYPPQRFAFANLSDSLTKPVPESPDDLVTTTKILSLSKVIDFDFLHDYQVLASFFSIHTFYDANDRFPQISDINAVKEIGTREKFLDQDELDESVLKPLILSYGAEISPMDAIFGGIVAQEVIKSLSGKFTPIHQFLAINYLQALPENIDFKFTPLNDRYDAYRQVFGADQQEKMQSLRYFMIGAGAIGCEILKNWAMMGISTKTPNQLRSVITDMDTIEKSNLSRQFLFRDSDIRKSKSETACAAVLKMNKDIRLESKTDKLAEETRDIFNDDFYESIDGVCNALDNIDARLFSDSLCVYYGKPLLESGTLGPKANYQVIIPKLTESYGDSVDPPETSIPQCTLHNYPTIMDHCCEWARDLFSGYFEKPPELVNRFVQNPAEFIASFKALSNAATLNALKTVKEAIITDRPQNYEDNLWWGRLRFEEQFNWRIRDLLNCFPLDHKNSDGTLFWSGHKRAPTPAEFNPQELTHLEFVKSAADIRSRIYGIPNPKYTNQQIIDFFNKTTKKVPEYVFNKSASDEGNEDGKKEELIVADDNPELVALIEEMKGVKANKLNLETFEKDDESNGHIDFIAASSNTRAINYRIATESKLEIKRIAGKIIPAIATTTAMICGFICMEMYKMHSIVPKKVDDFRNGFVSLAANLYSIADPMRPAEKKLFGKDDKKFTKWDNLEIPNNQMTVQEFSNWIKETTGGTLGSVTDGKKAIYARFQPRKVKAERMPRKLIDIDRELYPDRKGRKFVKLDCNIMDEQMEVIPSPPFILRLE